MTPSRKPDHRATKEERYSVSFPVALTWQDKSGPVRKINGRCLDLSSEGIKVETKERVAVGTVVLVTSNEFGRMGLALVRHVGRHKMNCLMGLRFSAAFGLGDPGRRKILDRVLAPEELPESAVAE